MELSVVIVSWNTCELLRDCLASAIREGAGEIFVVDNGSVDGSPQMVRREFPEVRLLEPGDNLGFARANELALPLASGRHLMLLNPDTVVLPGAFQKLIAYLDAHPRVGALGPMLLNPDGTLQPSACRFPSLLTEFYEWFGLRGLFPKNRALGRLYYGYRADKPMNADWVIGACLLVRQEVYLQVGGLDGRFFMYGEELDWCYRIRQAGWQIHYLPQAQVIHYGGQSAQKAASPQLVEYFRSRHQFHHKHHSPAVRWAMRLLYITSLGLRVAGYRLWARVFPRNRERILKDAIVFERCLAGHFQF